MKRKPLQVRCVFPKAGEDLRQIILRSFSLYLRRTLAGNENPEA